MKNKIILHLCADIGSDTKPYSDAGYTVIKVGIDIGVENFIPPENVHGVIANPVCTEFSTASGFHKTGDLEKGMFLVNHCLRIIKECDPKFWVIENPASGRLKQFLGKPSLAFLHKSAIKHIPEFSEFTVEDDAGFRSLCSQGFAKAFFEVNR